ncbi:Z1 domain-containing protein [Priestia endophytica]|uniref:Z1 domain-containing protein n=1 Tax=Priestia endophytica TaxID=135735 RepID=UPI00227EC2AC|nr:Z1 domain-containing protein [Priestia endophytica]MCY8233889.1 Z1 domain-containing protein [Priestia endophytica]
MSEIAKFKVINNKISACWNVKLDGTFTNHVMEKYFSKMDDEEREKLKHASAKILSYCVNPSGDNGISTLLGLGKVQSGKTSCINTVTALALDNTFPLVILLTGTKKNLFKQSMDRVKEDLGIEKWGNDIAFFSTFSAKSDLPEQDIIRLIKGGKKKILITVLKERTHISHLTKIFSLIDTTSLPTIIIDDEGDQASLNNKPKKPKGSTTFENIKQLRETFNLHSYIAYTATPQANLIKSFDILSPEACVLIPAGKTYTGGSTFHGKEQHKYIRTFSEEEGDIISLGDATIQLKKAMADFFIGAAIRSLRKDNDKHSMLVHISGNKNEHLFGFKIVEQLVGSWAAILSSNSVNNINKKELTSIFKESYQDFKTHTFKKIDSFERILKQVHDEFLDLKIWLVNSSKEGQVPTKDNMHFKNNILIGGNMLERGVTVEGLAVTYITRWAKKPNADTMEQRARWFGYKGKYLDLCRIYLTESLQKGFSDLLGHEDDLWSILEQLEENGEKIESWKSRIFRLSSPFIPTRKSVGSAEELKYGWIYLDFAEEKKSLARKNVHLVNKFFKENGVVKKYGDLSHVLCSNCNIDTIIGLLGDLLYLNEENIKTKHLIENIIKRLSNYDSLSYIDSVLIDPTKPRERSISSKGRFIKLPQGHSPRRVEADPKYYCGDANILKGKYQLQFHIVKPKKEDIPETVVLGLFVPENTKEHTGRMLKASV